LDLLLLFFSSIKQELLLSPPALANVSLFSFIERERERERERRGERERERKGMEGQEGGKKI
jgi:hypothetical protein